jgi:CBS domain-containing protein
VTRETSLHYALSMMLAEGTTRLDVVHGERVVGSVHMEAITRLIAPEDTMASEEPAASEPAAVTEDAAAG